MQPAEPPGPRRNRWRFGANLRRFNRADPWRFWDWLGDPPLTGQYKLEIPLRRCFSVPDFIEDRSGFGYFRLDYDHDWYFSVQQRRHLIRSRCGLIDLPPMGQAGAGMPQLTG